MLIFHRDWKIRKYLISLVVSPEVYQEFVSKNNEESANIPTFMGQTTNNDEANEDNDDSYENSKEENGSKFIGVDGNKSLGQGASAVGQIDKSKTMVIKDSEIYNMLKFDK